MTYLYTNNAVAQLSAGLGTSTTLIQLVSGQGAKFPNPTVGQTFQCTLFDAATQSVIEICTCTSRTSDTLTVVRAQEGTTASSYLIGDGLALRVTAGQLSDMASQTQGANFVGATTAVTAIYGDNSQKIATTAFVAQNTSPINAATLNSPAFTGTPTAPTASLGTSTTQLATTAFVANTAFSSALPAQTGNSGKFVTTNGTTASWSQVPVVNTSDATITTSTTLSGGLQYVPVAMSVINQSVTLPSATTLSIGFPQYIIRNTGSITFSIRDNSGVLIASVPSRATVFVMLTANGSSSGTWAVGNLSEFGTLNSANIGVGSSTGYSATTWVQLLQLSPATFLYLFENAGTEIYGCVYTLSGTTLTPGVVNTVIAANYYQGTIGQFSCVVSATQAVLCYVLTNSPYYFTSVTLNISGTTISIGTPLSGGGNMGVSGASLSICALSSNLVMVFGSQGSNSAIPFCTLSISGTTLSANTGFSPTPAYTSNQTGQLINISSTSALAIYPSSGNWLATVMSVSGTTISQGNTISMGTYTQNAYLQIVLAQGLSNTFLVATPTQIYSVVISGSTVVSVTLLTSMPVSYGALISVNATLGYVFTGTTFYEYTLIGGVMNFSSALSIATGFPSGAFTSACFTGNTSQCLLTSVSNSTAYALVLEPVK